MATRFFATYKLYAGKLGPWARGGCKGTRYLQVGLQGKHEYKKIISATKDKDTWYWIRVNLGDFSLLRSCNCNIYE